MKNNENNSIDENKSVEIDSSATTTAIVSASSNNGPKPEMFKLIDDCFERIFEWLSLKELLVLRRTCKRLKAAVDYYIKLNYPRVMCNRKDLLKFSSVRLGCFEWIKHLKLQGKVTDTQIDGIKYILEQLESLNLYQVEIKGDFYEKLLKFCPRLKYLSVETMSRTIIGTGNEWLKRRYPTLEHFKIVFSRPRTLPNPCAELLTFFHQNPNIRMLSVNCLLLLINRALFLGSNIKLDRLYISIYEDLNSICILTNDLYEQGFYKKLHLQIRPELVDEQQHLWSFRNIAELNFRCLISDIVPPAEAVKSIEELSIERLFVPFLNTPIFMSMSLINLRRVNMKMARLRDIQMFISHAPKLAQIRIYSILFGATDNIDDEPSVEDFFALNKERENLAGACQMVVYFQEKLVLKMKWLAKLKFSMIELKRISSCKIEHIPMEE